MRKYLGCLIIAIAISFIFSNVSFAANKVVENPNIKVFVSGKQVMFNSAPIIVNGEILLNARELLVQLGLPNDSKHIQLDEKNLVINDGKNQIKMIINSTKVTVGKSSGILNSSPVIYKNVYYIPVKSSVQLINLKFAWDDEEKSIYIQKVSDYNKVKAVLDKAITATKEVEKYVVKSTQESVSDYKDQPCISKDITIGKVDKKKLIMTINSTSKDTILGDRTTNYYLYNNYLYSKYSSKEKWEKELLSKKDYKEWILNYDVSKYKISDILYCGLTIQENIKENSFILKGAVYLHVNKKDYDFEPVNTYLEFNINKSSNLINKITHNYSEYWNSTDSDRYLYDSKETFEYKDYNGDYIIETPDESKMEFDTKSKSENIVTPIELSDDEERKMNALSSSINKVAVDGAWKHSYNLDITQAIMFIVIKNQNDFDTFTNLSDDAKKVFINQIVQDNYGDYLGCETVYGMVYYKGKVYTDIITGYNTVSENVKLEKYNEGFDITIIVQDKKNNTYKNYEGE